jgi:glycine dehydrogenase subunit 2
MSMNSQGRPSAPQNRSSLPASRGMMLEDKLIFELDNKGSCGVDLPDVPDVPSRLGGIKPRAEIGLPALSEPDMVRHYTPLY